MASPLFSIGQEVVHPASHFNEREGVIVKMERTFKEIMSNGKFKPRGLVTGEDLIPHIVLEKSFNGEELKVQYPGGTIMVSRFFGYSYLVKDKFGNLASFPEKMLNFKLPTKVIDNRPKARKELARIRKFGYGV